MRGVLQSLNENAGAIQAIATAAMLLITGWYARLTYRLVKVQEAVHRERTAELRSVVLTIRQGLLGRVARSLSAIRQAATQTSKRDQHGPSIVQLGSVHSHRPALLGSGRGWLDVLYDPPLDSTSGSRTTLDRRTKGSRHRRDDSDILISSQCPANWRTAIRPATSALHRVVGASQAMRCAGCCLTSA